MEPFHPEKGLAIQFSIAFQEVEAAFGFDFYRFFKMEYAIVFMIGGIIMPLFAHLWIIVSVFAVRTGIKAMRK